MEEKFCNECGVTIRGRSDKKFCTDMCRNSYNNRVNSDTNNFMRNINNVLRRNRRIMEEILQTESEKVSKSKLMELGFNFQFYTHQQKLRKGLIYHFCYEFGYQVQESDFVYLIQRREKARLNRLEESSDNSLQLNS
ncbi:hypothetical protein BH11BAC2_BH11BAC2_23260 [soil metagenome]